MTLFTTVGSTYPIFNKKFFKWGGLKPLLRKTGHLMLVLLATTVWLPLSSQSSFTFFEEWTGTDGSQPSSTNQNALLDRVATVTDGSRNLFTASSTYNVSTTVHDLLLTKHNSGGTLQWSQQFNVSGGGDVLVGGIALDASGNVLFTGSVLKGSNSFDALTVKFTSAGSVSWYDTWNGSVSGYDGGVAVVTDNSNNVYITGVATEGTVDRDFLTRAYSTSGTVLWTQLFDNNGLVDIAAKLGFNGGYLAVSGAVQQSNGVFAVAAIKYNLSNGSVIASGIVSSNIQFDEVNGFATDASGNIYIAGARLNAQSNLDFLTIKLNSDLTVLWEEVYDLDSNKQVANALGVDASGNVFVTGYTEGGGTGRDYLTLKYDDDGTLLWDVLYNGADSLNDEATDLVVDASGNIFVTGYSHEVGNADYYTAWYAASDGDELWGTRFNSIYNRSDKAAVIQLDGDGNLLVTGRTTRVDSLGAESTGTTTVKYTGRDIIIPPDGEAQSKAIAFVKNNGQLLQSDLQPAENVKFYADGFPQLYLQENTVSFVISNFDGDTSIIDTTWRVDMVLGIERELALIPLDARSDYANYYMSHISEGREQVLSYQQMLYSNAFSGIDLLLSSNGVGLKYDFVVKSGADPDDIDLYFDGQTNLSVNMSGELTIGTDIGSITFPAPKALQIVDGTEVEMTWDPEYVITDNNVSITTGTYDNGDPLIIRIIRDTEEMACDPVGNSGLEYSTYYGGSHNDGAYDIAPGVPTQALNSEGGGAGIGTAYITGMTYSNNFPVLGQSITSLQGSADAFVVCLQDLARLWSIYYGGHGGETVGQSVGFDVGNKSIWVGGFTGSAALPVTNPEDFPYNDFIGTPPITTGFFRKGFIAKFSEDGFLIYSTYFGGDGYSTVNSLDISIDGHVFFGGRTQPGLTSNELENNGGLFYKDPENNGESFITEFDPLGQLVWSTEFAQEGSRLIDLNVDSEGDLIITGVVDFISPTAIVLDFVEQSGINDLFITDAAGETDVYIAKFNTQENQRQLIWSTLFTGPGVDHPWEVKTDSKDNIVILGATTGPTLHPDINVANSFNGCSDIFLAKFNSDGVIQKAIFHGGSGSEGSDSPQCIALPASGFSWTRMGLAFDDKDNIYVTANTLSEDFPVIAANGTYNQPLLGNSTTDPGTGDVTVIGFDSNLNPFWATHFGGMSEPNNWVGSTEHGTGIVIVANKLYVVGLTKSDCPVKLPLKDNSLANYYTDDLNLDIVHEQSVIPDAFITVFAMPDTPTSANEPTDDGKVNIFIYPVPADQYVDIRIPSTPSELELFVVNLIGEQVLRSDLPALMTGDIRIPTSSLPSGVYFLVVKGAETYISEKFIVHHPR